MSRNIVIERVRGVGIEEQRVEVVERKGLGHPDYMADSIAEVFSRDLSRYYLENFGKILHHNVDKLEIIGGKTEPEFGGGQVLMPLSILFSGRATDAFGGDRLPVKEIATHAANRWISENLRFIDLNSVRYLFETKSGSGSLANVYQRLGVFSNDTSFGAGYAPLSVTENIVLELENVMNSWEFKYFFPYSGEDVKVLAVRDGKRIDITIANAIVDRYISSLDDYFEKKSKLLEDLLARTRYLVPSEYDLNVSLNSLDDRNHGKNGCYLTVTGTSAEHGDDGAVGRGNRVNGLITPNRTMSFEAIAGKNPVNHIGKIYNILSKRIAEDVFENTGKPATVKIVGRIGDPIDSPIVAVISSWKSISADEERRIKEITDEHLSNIHRVTEALLKGSISIC